MRPTENIEKLIKKLKYKSSNERRKRIFNNVTAVLDNKQKTKPAKITPNIWRIIMKARITRFSSVVAIILCLFGLLVFFGNGEVLYAQVKEAFEKARSIHVVMTEFRDGNWFKEHELWYESNLGVREEERYEKQTDIRIDNNQYEWRYTAGDKTAAEVSSYRKPDEWAKDVYQWLRFEHARVPSGDKVIKGIPCEMYVLTTPNKNEINVWVDKNYRLMEFEQEEHRNGQVIRTTATIEYDKEFDEDIFSPNFDADVKIVGPSELIQDKFPLETAVFKRESLGFVYAVHTLDFGDGFKYLVCSNRITEQTRSEISDGNPWTYYGGFDLFGRHDQYGMYYDSSDVPIRLAKMRHDGIQVDWYLLVPFGDEAKQTAGCDVDVRINTANQLKKKLEAEGLPIQEKFRLNIKLGETKEQLLSLEDVTSQIFSLGIELSPIVHSFSLTKIVTESDGNRVQAYKKPGVELSEEDFLKNCNGRIEYYLNQN